MLKINHDGKMIAEGLGYVETNGHGESVLVLTFTSHEQSFINLVVASKEAIPLSLDPGNWINYDDGSEPQD